MQLIVNGDDLGYSPAVNQAILALSAAGKLSSASLVANLPHAGQAMEMVKGGVGFAVGVHLNLTKGKPCLSPERVGSMIRPDGEFHRTPALFARAAAGALDPDQVRAELRAQIDRALDCGVLINHLDSHSHWQVFPRLNRILTDLAREYKVSRVRVVDPRRTLVPNRTWLAMVRRTPLPPGLPAQTDYMLSLHQWLAAGGAVSPLLAGEQVRRILDMPGATLEMVVHAGSTDDPDFPPDTLPTLRRQWEVDYLSGGAFIDWLELIGGVIQQNGAIP